MIIYADILIILNLLVDYFLLLITAKLLEIKCITLRLFLSSVVGGFSSLYIFLPRINTITDFLYKLFVCAFLAFISHSFKNLKQYLKFTILLFTVTCVYAGFTAAVWHIFKPNGMLINNSVVYFDISPIALTLSTVIFYVTFIILNRIFKNSSNTAQKCEITVFSGKKSLKLRAIVDSGNSVEDFFGKSEIIITDNSSFETLFGEMGLDSEEYKKRFRIVPCSTVTGEDILKGYRCDNAVVIVDGESFNLNKPILAVSKVDFRDDYNAIVNPKIFK